MKKPLRTFPVSAGLLEPEHIRAIDPSSPWPIYLWFIEHVTRDEPAGDGNFLGIVSNGRPVSVQQIAAELGIGERSSRRHLSRLVKAGYVLQKKTGVGTCTYIVTKSKRWFYKRQPHIDGSKAPESQANLFSADQGESRPTHQNVASGSDEPTHQNVALGSPTQRPHLSIRRTKQASAEGGTRARSQYSQRSGEKQTPPGSELTKLARTLIAVLSKVETNPNLKLMEGSIVAEAAYRGCSFEDATQAIAQIAMEAQRRGVAIDRWYFEDTKWRPKKKLDQGQGPPRKTVSEMMQEQEASLALVRSNGRASA